MRVGSVLIERKLAMLYYALMSLFLALIAGILGFGVVAFAAGELARIVFFIFIVLFLVSLIAHFWVTFPHGR
jgi:uncharacterized membrane protein YtjA (UPF0391 family)